MSCSLDRLTLRLSSVEVSVQTFRNETQETALCEVNELINLMVKGIQVSNL